MTSTARPRPHRSAITPLTGGTGLTMLALAVVLAIAVSRDPSVTGADGPTAVRTGEQNAMGMPVIETPGASDGTATAGTVDVSGATWALGAVPLNTAVRPTWVLRNTGAEPVTIGDPHSEVREGCCPGPFTLDTRTIPPGGQARLDFELSMHPGMDGWHDIAVHVPVSAGSRQDTLNLAVTGDFRDR